MAARKRRSTKKKSTRAAKRYQVKMMKAGKTTTVDTLATKPAANALAKEVRKQNKSATVWVKEA